MEFLAPLACVWLLIFYLKFKHFSIILCTLYISIRTKRISSSVYHFPMIFLFHTHHTSILYSRLQKRVRAQNSFRAAVCVCRARCVFFFCLHHIYILFILSCRRRRRRTCDALCFYVRDAFRVFTVYIHTYNMQTIISLSYIYFANVSTIMLYTFTCGPAPTKPTILCSLLLYNVK